MNALRRPTCRGARASAALARGWCLRALTAGAVAAVALSAASAACDPRPREDRKAGSQPAATKREQHPTAVPPAPMAPVAEPAVRSAPPDRANVRSAPPTVAPGTPQGAASPVSANPAAAATPASQDSATLIRRASHIVVLRVLRAVPGSPQLGNGSTKQSTALTLDLVAVLKGRLDARPGARAELTVEQFAPVGTRVYAIPGGWSGLELAGGSEYVLFANTPAASSFESVIAPSTMLGVLASADARADVALAMPVELGKRKLAALLGDRAARRAHDTLAGYLAERITQQLMFGDATGFEQAMRLVEARELAARPRTLLVEAVAARAQAPEAPPRFVARTALGVFRLIALSEASALHDSLLANDLPPLLARVRTAEVFAGAAADLRSARAALSAYRGPSDVTAVRAWLNAP